MSTPGPVIEHLDDGFAVLTLTGDLDRDGAAALHTAAALLAAQERRFLAVDLTGCARRCPDAIVSLAALHTEQQGRGGELFVIGGVGAASDPHSVRHALPSVRAFADRTKWDRWGGLKALPAPHPVRYATPEQVLLHAVTFNGVPLVELGEDGETVLALGHHHPDRFLAALRSLARHNGCEPADCGLDEIPADFATTAADWSVFYAHARLVDVGGAKPQDPDAERCVCDDGADWYVVDAAQGAAHAVATMTWQIEV